MLPLEREREIYCIIFENTNGARFLCTNIDIDKNKSLELGIYNLFFSFYVF